MTWTVQIGGHDDLEAELKEAFENGLVSKVAQLVEDIKTEGVTISNANVTTNTTGPVDILGATEGNGPTTDEVSEDSEEVPDDDEAPA